MIRTFVSFVIRSRAGFTLLEVLVSVSILVIIGLISIVSFVNSRNIRDLTSQGQNVISILKLAQSKALSGEDGSQWGVYLENAQYVLFRGSGFLGATFTQVYPLPANIEIVNVSLAGGGSDVIFKRLNGKTDQAGTFELRVRGATNLIFSVTIDSSGKAYQTGTAPAVSGSRIIDTRHRQFVLGWSIKTYDTLTLTFSDPPNPDNTVSNIATASFFNADKTKFDWSGSVVVGGQGQIMRIHTTSLTDTDTTLLADRDCRENSKKVNITISKASPLDIRDIATYEADCRTIIVGPYGGTPPPLEP